MLVGYKMSELKSLGVEDGDIEHIKKLGDKYKPLK
jgi:hypothetical protein